MIAMYPGTFDPMTNGHIDIIERATKLIDKVIVAVAADSGKNTLFGLDERAELIRSVTDPAKVSVETFTGLTVHFAQKRGVKTIIRGLRMISDFEFEFQMALTNRVLAEEMETIFMMPKQDCLYISSRMVKELFALKGDISQFVPPQVVAALASKMKVRS
jgi:pantetheine-phosphate adenylyltransferase